MVSRAKSSQMHSVMTQTQVVFDMTHGLTCTASVSGPYQYAAWSMHVAICIAPSDSQLEGAACKACADTSGTCVTQLAVQRQLTSSPRPKEQDIE